MARVLVTTIPFGERDRTPLNLLTEAGHDVLINPLARKLQGEELGDIGWGFDAVVAGTETISAAVLEKLPGLKLISRVGIGLDSVDLNAARDRGISVAYTPDGPSAAVAELTIGLMIDLLRGVQQADRDLAQGVWKRVMGRRLACVTVGVIGVGRIGKKVIRHLTQGFPGVTILANDLEPDQAFGLETGITWTTKEDIFARADVITLHLPYTGATQGLIGAGQLAAMKSDAVLVNTARGGIIVESDLETALKNEVISGAATDVFVTEPYEGPLAGLPGSIVTCHMGSMSEDCRARMEREACEEVIRFFKGEPFLNPIPDQEYDIAAMRHG
ncbi:MAG: phosphoglycerate dehydrogenase [Rhodospirillales bacterium]